MNIKTFPVIALILALVFVGMYSMVNELAATEAYDVDVDDSYNRYGHLLDSPETIAAKDGLKDMTSDKEAQFFTGTWDSIKRGITLTYDSYEAIGNSTEVISRDLQIPKPVKNAIGVFLALALIALIITLVLRIK